MIQKNTYLNSSPFSKTLLYSFNFWQEIKTCGTLSILNICSALPKRIDKREAKRILQSNTMLSKTRMRIKLVKDLLKNSDWNVRSLLNTEFCFKLYIKDMMSEGGKLQIVCSFLQLSSLIQSCIKHDVFWNSYKNSIHHLNNEVSNHWNENNLCSLGCTSRSCK